MSKLGAELGMSIHSLPQPDPRLPIPSAKIGIEVEIEKWDGKNGTEYWEDKDDPSVHDKGREFITRGPIIGMQIVPAVDEICRIALERKYSTGEPRAGIHIHLDCTDLDTKRKELARLVAKYMLIEHAMFGFAGAWRDSCGYCVSYESGQVDFPAIGAALFAKGKVSKRTFANLSKYQALNLKPLSDLGTIEFRHLPTTFDRTRLLNWISVILAIKRSAIEDEGDDFDILKKFSNIGPREYAEQILGDQYFILRDFIDPNRMWDAADNAISIMGAASAIKLDATWGKEADGPPSPLIAKKLEQMMKPKKAASNKGPLYRSFGNEQY